jgi:acyl dehydratase
MMIAAAHRLLRIVPSSGIQRTETFQSIVRHQQARRCLSKQSSSGIRRTETFQSIVRHQQARRCLSQQSLNINSAASPKEDEGGIKDEGVFLIGETLDSAADLQSFRPGDRLDIPYELTVSESMQDFWQSAFHAQDRISTSKPFCRKMGLQDRVLPFSLALFLTSSMTHADSAKVQVGFGRVNYLWPCFAGDTFTKTFTVESMRNTSDGHHSVRVVEMWIVTFSSTSVLSPLSLNSTFFLFCPDY